VTGAKGDRSTEPARVVPGLDPLLSEEGWAYASLPPQEPGDPGRFHALFGRDSLICALQVLPAAPQVAQATLRALASRQGSVVDPDTDEEPGKILHEFRPEAGAWFSQRGWPVRDGALLYYGTADATSWFLIVLAALDDAALRNELEPAWRAAADWLVGALRAGGGLVRHGPRRGAGGLPSRAGVTRSPRSSITRRARASFAPTVPSRSRRWPTPTARRRPSRRSTRSRASIRPAIGRRGQPHCVHT